MNKLDMAAHFAVAIEHERKRLCMTQEEIAKRLDLSLSGYRKIIKHEVDTLSYWTLYKAYKLTGRYSFELCGVDDPNIKALADAKNLSEYQRAFIQSVIEFELEFAHQRAGTGTDGYITVLVPTGNVKDGMLWDSCDLEKVEATDYLKKYGSRLSLGIKVTSNHLHPAYNKGDILLICRQAPRDGDTGVFLNKEEGRAYLRRFIHGDVCRLEPVNGYGDTFFVDSSDKADMDKWLKFGYVLTKIR